MAAAAAITLFAEPGSVGFTEQIRVFLAEIGIKYTEVAKTQADVPKMNLLFDTLPAVSFGGQDLVQTEAIMEHIAVVADKEQRGRGNTYLGRGEDERSFARAFLSAGNNLRRDLYEQYVEPGRRQNRAKFESETLPRWLTLLNTQATESSANDLGIGPGTSFTFGDIGVFEAINQIVTTFGPASLDKYRELKAWYLKVADRARIRIYLDNRK